MIGLVDLDLLLTDSVRLTYPNLEIMKLATYYKTEENQFCRLLQLDEQDVSSYDKIYCYSELHSIEDVPKFLYKNPHLQLGGAGLTNGKYIPFENSIIDFTLPRIFIYKDYLKEKYNSGVKNKIISNFLDNSYYRMYAGKEQLPISPIMPKKKVVLYDKDFFYPNWEEIITTLAEKNPSSIVRIHPIVCNTLTQYFTIRNFNKLARMNEVILDLNIPSNEIQYMLKHYKNLFLADITRFSNVFLPLGGALKTDLQYLKDYIFVLNLLFSFWSCKIPIKLKYLKSNIGTKNPIEHLEEITMMWANNFNKVHLENYIKRRKKDTVLKEQKDFLLHRYPTEHHLMIQTFSSLSEGGIWRS